MTERLVEILIVEDDPREAEKIREGLAAARLLVSCKFADSMRMGAQMLECEVPQWGSFQTSVVVIDARVLTGEGMGVLERLLEGEASASVTFLVLADSAGADPLRSRLKRFTQENGAAARVRIAVRDDGPFFWARSLAKAGDFWLMPVRHSAPGAFSSSVSEGRRQDLYFQALSGRDGLVRLLLIEDSDSDARWAVGILNGRRKGGRGSEARRSERDAHSLHYEIRRATSLHEAKSLLLSLNFDLVLLDLSLPDSRDEETLSRVIELRPDLPVVVLTGRDDLTEAIRALRGGAQDHLVKGEIRDKKILDRILSYAIERKAQSREQLRLLENERAARRETQRAIAARDEFFSIASHELKSPLTSLLLHLQLLRRQCDSAPLLEGEELERLRDLLWKSQSQVTRLNRLIANLLDLSRIQSGRVDVFPVEMDLAAALREIAARFQPDFDASSTRLELSLPEKLTGIWDPGGIDQMVTNLLENALKYAAGKRVELRAGVVGEEAWIEVADQGPGIEAEDMKRIFQRFERARPPGPASGVGLGLFITRRIAQAHQGAVDVSSLPGKGTTFTVKLPLRPAARQSA